MDGAAAAIERSDVCAVPAAAVVGEAMVALVLADALLEKFGGDSIAEIERAMPRAGPRRRADAFPASRSQARLACSGPMSALRRFADPAYGTPAHAGAEVTVFDDDLQRLIDDMIETMYAAPGVGLAATAGRRAAARLRRRYLGRPRTARADRRWSTRSSSSARACSSKRKAA